jgi:hypothetical protein
MELARLTANSIEKEHKSSHTDKRAVNSNDNTDDNAMVDIDESNDNSDDNSTSTSIVNSPALSPLLPSNAMSDDSTLSHDSTTSPLHLSSSQPLLPLLNLAESKKDKRNRQQSGEQQHEQDDNEGSKSIAQLRELLWNSEETAEIATSESTTAAVAPKAKRKRGEKAADKGKGDEKSSDSLELNERNGEANINDEEESSIAEVDESKLLGPFHSLFSGLIAKSLLQRLIDNESNVTNRWLCVG